MDVKEVRGSFVVGVETGVAVELELVGVVDVGLVSVGIAVGLVDIAAEVFGEGSFGVDSGDPPMFSSATLGLGIGPLGLGIGPLGLGIGPLGLGIGPLGLGIGPLGLGIDPLGLGIGTPRLGIDPLGLGIDPLGLGIGVGPQGLGPSISDSSLSTSSILRGLCCK